MIIPGSRVKIKVPGYAHDPMDPARVDSTSTFGTVARVICRTRDRQLVTRDFWYGDLIELVYDNTLNGWYEEE